MTVGAGRSASDVRCVAITRPPGALGGTDHRGKVLTAYAVFLGSARLGRVVHVEHSRQRLSGRVRTGTDYSTVWYYDCEADGAWVQTGRLDPDRTPSEPTRREAVEALLANSNGSTAPYKVATAQ